MPGPVKYYPVLACLKLLLNDESAPIVSFRASIVSRPGEFVVDYRLTHRFVTEYKGSTFSCNESVDMHVQKQRVSALIYLSEKIDKLNVAQMRRLAPVQEVVIDLTGVAPVPAP